MNSLVVTARNQQWLAMIHQQKQSGMTVACWCKENGISENCFYYRQQKLREIYGSQFPIFAEIHSPSSDRHLHLENLNSAASIHAGSVTFSLTNDASEELIARIVRVLYAQ